MQKVTPDAFGEWLSRSRVKWARLLSDGMQWMQDHRELLVNWRCDEGLSYKSIKDRLQNERGISTDTMTVLAFFRKIGEGTRSVSESQRISKRFKAAQKAKPNACGNFRKGYRPWSEEESGLLKQLKDEGKSVEFMSIRLNRSARAICHKIDDLYPAIDIAI